MGTAWWREEVHTLRSSFITLEVLGTVLAAET